MPRVIGPVEGPNPGIALQVEGDDGKVTTVPSFAVPRELMDEYRARTKADAESAAAANEAEAVAKDAQQQRLLALPRWQRPDLNEGQMSAEDAEKHRAFFANQPKPAAPEAPHAAPESPAPSALRPASDYQTASTGTPPAPAGGPLGAMQASVTAHVPSFQPSGGGGLSTKGLQGALAAQQKAEKDAYESGRAVAAQRAGFEEQQAQEMAARQAQAAEQTQRAQAAVDARMGELDKAMKAAQTEDGEVSAGRWWNSRNTGQKILAGLSAFLSGFGGGPQYIQEAIQQDIQLQKETLERRRALKSQGVQNARTLLEVGYQQLGNTRAAEEWAEGKALQLAAQKARVFEAKAADATYKANADKAAAALSAESEAKLLSARKLAFDSHIQEEQLGIQRAELGIKAVAATAKGSKDKVPAELAAKLGNYKAATKELAALEDAFKSKTGIFSAVASSLPATAATEYEDQRRTAAQAIGTILEGGKLTDADTPKYMAMIPAASDSEARKAAKLVTLRRVLANARDSQLTGLHDAGYDTSGFEARTVPFTGKAQ